MITVAVRPVGHTRISSPGVRTPGAELAGEERNIALARWEREGKIVSECILNGWGADNRRDKTRVVQVWKTLHRDELSVTQEVVKITYDGRLPYPPEDVFARIALAVMALT